MVHSLWTLWLQWVHSLFYWDKRSHGLLNSTQETVKVSDTLGVRKRCQRRLRTSNYKMTDSEEVEVHTLERRMNQCLCLESVKHLGTFLSGVYFRNNFSPLTKFIKHLWTPCGSSPGYICITLTTFLSFLFPYLYIYIKIFYRGFEGFKLFI